MTMTVLWYTALYSIVEVDRRFRGEYCLQRRYTSTRLHDSFPESYRFHNRPRENLKSHINVVMLSLLVFWFQIIGTGIP
jgi:hypothetical protein